MYIFADMNNLMSLLSNKKDFPQKGDKVKFTGANKMFYPHFTDMVERAQKNLKLGEIYTISEVEVHSSWCCVWLEGFGDGERDYYNLGMFEYPVLDFEEFLKSRTQESRVLHNITELRNASDKLELLYMNTKLLLAKYHEVCEENKKLKEFIQNLDSLNR